MFYHNNGKLAVCAQTRCGSTSMENYFGFKYGGARVMKPELFDNNLILVLRNPLDRMASAVKGLTPAFVQNMFKQSPRGEVTKRLRELSSDEAYKFVVFRTHAMPYLSNIIHNDFRIIDFYKLGDYIPMHENISVSPITNSSGYTNPKEVYVENNYFKIDALESEYETYKQLLSTREQISVEEWQQKTP